MEGIVDECRGQSVSCRLLRAMAVEDFEIVQRLQPTVWCDLCDNINVPPLNLLNPGPCTVTLLLPAQLAASRPFQPAPSWCGTAEREEQNSVQKGQASGIKSQGTGTSETQTKQRVQTAAYSRTSQKVARNIAAEQAGGSSKRHGTVVSQQTAD